MPTARKLTIPKNLADLADLYYQTKEERLALDRKAEEKKSYETQLRQALLTNPEKSGATAIGGKLIRASLVRKEVPQVKDWEALYSYVAKSRNFFLLQKRLSTSAVAELWESGQQVPGVDSVTVTDLSINKL